MFKFNRSILCLSAAVADIATGGGTATATPAATAGDVTTTPGAATAATTPTAPTRGRGAAGKSVFSADSADAAKALAKEKGGKFHAYNVKVEGKPERFYVTNHRAALMHKVLGEDGYVMDSLSKGGGGRPADPKKAAQKAEALIETLDVEARKALFAKYASAGAFDLINNSNLPPIPARDDTSPEFKAATATTPAANRVSETLAGATAGKSGNGAAAATAAKGATPANTAKAAATPAAKRR